MPSVGKPHPHDSAVGHVTGEALFIDDMQPMRDELYVSFVGSPVTSGKLKTVDVSAALDVDGVVGCFTHADIGGENRYGLIFQDEPFLAVDKLLYLGQPVVVVAAESRAALAEARHAVKIDAKPTTPVLGIDDAIAKELFIGPPRQIRRGDPEAALADAPHRLAGTFHSGGQEQFYLESQAALAYPGEQDQLVVYSSTQNTSEIQAVVAEVLGLGQHQVVCICKRMGGAFGGKESQAAIPALMAALVTQKTGRSARVIYNKDDDMKVTGKRHQYQTDWDVGFDDQGRISALVVNFFSNGGAAADLSTSVMERSMLHIDNAYYLPNVEVNGRVCFTNLPPNTAFRGFGGPQGMAVIENILEEIATHRGVDSFDLRLRNVYGVGERNITPYGQIFDRNHLPEIFSTVAAQARYRDRRKQVATFNDGSQTHLRGLAMTGMKFGIAFTTRFLNQANALVNVYTDGTIQVSTGATEMGQGVNVKIQQLVADEFAIAPDRVIVMPTSTEKTNNTSATAASASTDLNGAAAVRACQQIKYNLTRFAARHFAIAPDGVAASTSHIAFAGGFVYDRRRPDTQLLFSEICDLARRERVNLGARGFFATPGVDFNRETGKGNPFFYFTQGAAVAEVLIDRFTGDVRVPRVDLLIDIGKSINPAVDRGQITGAFIQGLGWVTTECLVYDDRGDLLSHSPTTYKIPAITDVPTVFNVNTFDNDDNIKNIRRSKAVGEPPLMLGIAVWAAIKNALSHVSQPAATELKLPATNEEVLRCLTAAEPAGVTDQDAMSTRT